MLDLKKILPKSTHKSLKVLTYAVISTLLSFAANYALTGKVDLVEFEAVVRTYLFNLIMVFAVYFRESSE